MYKNPLNNGDISDYNSLKKQMDNGSKVKKYQSVKLQTKPTELQKYYQYQTYQQPILDELNYVAERMRNEDIKKKTDEYDFIEGLKIKREKKMNETSKKEGEDIAREELFDVSSTEKNDDITPIINTDVELEFEISDRPDYNNNTEQYFIYEDLSFDANNNINNLSYNQPLLLEDNNNNLSYNEPLLLEDKKIKKAKKLDNEIFELSRTDIDKEKKQIISAKKQQAKEEEIKAKKAAAAVQKDVEKFSNIPANKRKGGKGGKGKLGSKGGRILDLTK